MREALGGTLLLYIVLSFLIVYIFFMAFVINYGRVFKAKNTAVLYIEQDEGFNEETKRKILDIAGYTGEIKICKLNRDTRYDQFDRKATYYKVKLYVEFDLPGGLFEDNKGHSKVNVAVTGQTDAIYETGSNSSRVTDCDNGYDTIR